MTGDTSSPAPAETDAPDDAGSSQPLGREPKVGREAMKLVRTCVVSGLDVDQTVAALRERGYQSDYADIRRAWKSAQQYHTQERHLSPKPGSMAYWICQYPRTLSTAGLIKLAAKCKLGEISAHTIHTARSKYRHLFNAKGRSSLSKLPAPRAGNSDGRRGPRKVVEPKRSSVRQAAPAPAPAASTARAPEAPPKSLDPARQQLRALILDVGLKVALDVFAEFQHIRNRIGPGST